MARLEVCEPVYAAQSAEGKPLTIRFPAICRIPSSNSRDAPAPQLKQSSQSNSQKPEWPSGPNPQVVRVEDLCKASEVSLGAERSLGPK